jgi:hypothetical protein
MGDIKFVSKIWNQLCLVNTHKTDLQSSYNRPFKGFGGLKYGKKIKRFKK